MPVFNLVCSTCGETSKVLRKSEKEISKVKCAECKGKMVRAESSPPSSRIVEVLDNGLMSKSVERPADAERLYKERAQEDTRRFNEDQGLFGK